MGAARAKNRRRRAIAGPVRQRTVRTGPDMHRTSPAGQTRFACRAGRQNRCNRGQQRAWRQQHRQWARRSQRLRGDERGGLGRRAIDIDEFGHHIDRVPELGPVDHHLGIKGHRPWLELDVDLDKFAGDIGRQHDDADAVDIFKLGRKLGFLQQFGNLRARRDGIACAIGAELRGLHEGPETAIVEFIRGDRGNRKVGQHRCPADPVRAGAPEHPARAEFAAWHPEPADWLAVHPAAVMVHNLAPGRLVIVVPAILLGVDPVAGLIGVPAFRRARRNPDFAIDWILDKRAKLHKNRPELVLHGFAHAGNRRHGGQRGIGLDD